MNKDPIQQNIEGVQQLVGSKTNKVPYASSSAEGPADGEREDSFTLKLSDSELLDLRNKWEAKYQGYEAKIKAKQEKNKKYYLGQQEQGSPISTEFPIESNILFDAEETFLTAALAKKPEPLGWSDNTPEGTELSNQVKTMLQYHSDVLVLRRKLALMVRHWSVFYL